LRTKQSTSGAEGVDFQTPRLLNGGQPKSSTVSSMASRLMAKGLCFQPRLNSFLARMVHLLQSAA
jgi:hypothetical protein